MAEMLAVTTTPALLAEVIMRCPELRCAVMHLILQDVDKQCRNLCNRSADNSSVLRTPRSKHKDLKKFTWESVVMELRQRAPDVLDFLMTVAFPQPKKDNEKKVPALCLAYGVLMNTRWQKLSLIQKINTMLLGIGHATARTFQRLNRMGVTQTRESYRMILEDIGADLKTTIINQLCGGQQLRVCYDNIDFRVLVNVTLKDHRNSDKHWIAQYLTFDRVPSHGLDDTKPLNSDPSAFDNINYLLEKDELDKLRQDFIVLVARVFVEFFNFMKPLANSVPGHILHCNSCYMQEKSTIIGLPVVPFNQSKQADVCQYLDQLQTFLTSLSLVQDEEAPNNAANCKVPVIGDLLGRERITGAKRTRMGCDQPSDRYENIVSRPLVKWNEDSGYEIEPLHDDNRSMPSPPSAA